MNNVCELNKDSIEILKNKVDLIEKNRQDEIIARNALVDKHKPYIKATLLTLCNCIDTSTLSVHIGNKRVLYPEAIMYAVDELANNGDKLRSKLYRHDEYLLQVVNEITLELWGEQYDISHKGMGDVEYIWKDETVLEYIKYQVKYHMEYWLSREMLFIYLILSMISIPLTIVCIVLVTIEALFTKKWSTSIRELVK